MRSLENSDDVAVYRNGSVDVRVAHGKVAIEQRPQQPSIVRDPNVPDRLRLVTADGSPARELHRHGWLSVASPDTLDDASGNGIAAERLGSCAHECDLSGAAEMLRAAMVSLQPPTR